MLSHAQGLITVAHACSEELGKEVEALATAGSDPERLGRVRKLVNREFGKHAVLVYEAIVATLCSPR